ncbi:Prostate-associated microseminoprotein [Camelus dromedarius]|uniref:Prostate-associated microseminoprotein n=1 Tax=Camelus dromedarius TaxID=9838 RepID=A0A5N4EBV2_CAMDR|nr:Prostate-associated microseminoprotein [Camelus dromedarius]
MLWAGQTKGILGGWGIICLVMSLLLQHPGVHSKCYFQAQGPSILSISRLGVRYVRRQEPASSPWYRNLTPGCPAKGEGPTQSGAQLTPLFLRLLLPTPAKLN